MKKIEIEVADVEKMTTEEKTEHCQKLIGKLLCLYSNEMTTAKEYKEAGQLMFEIS